ncbi:hypothetical protein SAMN05216167_10278 [Spirosoma endophyticum]|uniref:Uncharacterized protein n=1 Tax=Spirosoma endophyticum TaxID=662367 RepID=A0A1I1KXM7_9BACT|nr:hypothetical protein SAMN05216167_10278 [Spirosoma endophyticum]
MINNQKGRTVASVTTARNVTMDSKRNGLNKKKGIQRDIALIAFL